MSLSESAPRTNRYVPQSIVRRVLFLRGPLQNTEAALVTADDAVAMCSAGAPLSFFGHSPEDVKIGELLPQLEYYKHYQEFCINDRVSLLDLQTAWRAERDAGVFSNTCEAGEEMLMHVFGLPRDEDKKLHICADKAADIRLARFGADLDGSFSTEIEFNTPRHKPKMVFRKSAACILARRASISAIEHLYASTSDVPDEDVIAICVRSGRTASTEWVLRRYNDVIFDLNGKFWHKYSQSLYIPLMYPRSPDFKSAKLDMDIPELLFTLACRAPHEDSIRVIDERFFTDSPPKALVLEQAFLNALQQSQPFRVLYWLTERFGCYSLRELMIKFARQRSERTFCAWEVIVLDTKQLLTAMKTLIERSELSVPEIPDALFAATELDDVDVVCSYVRGRDEMYIKDIAQNIIPTTAAQHGSVAVLRWALANGLSESQSSMNSAWFSAVRAGRIDSLKILFEYMKDSPAVASETELKIFPSVWREVFLSTRLETAKELIAFMPNKFKSFLDELKELKKHYDPNMPATRLGSVELIRGFAMRCAACGAFEMAEWLRSIDLDISSSSESQKIRRIFQDGKYILGSYDMYYVANAIERGKKEVVRWFLEECVVDAAILKPFVENIGPMPLRRDSCQASYTIFSMKDRESIYSFKDRITRSSECLNYVKSYLSNMLNSK